MARDEYGKTWWGEQWLLALTKIDFSNRIPRGKSYARKGSVLSVAIDNGKIEASVSGSNPKPYNVKLSMDEISTPQISTLMDKIKMYPSIVSKLQNGKIDPLLLDISTELGIQILPSKAKDMKMHCSCPDDAVPCKHIAAAIYIVCSEIDNNPFALFKFRNIDLTLLSSSMDIVNETTQVSTLEDLIKANVSHHKIEYQETAILEQVKFKNRHIELLTLLENEPPFYPKGNFKEKYGSALTKLSKEAAKINKGTSDLNAYTGVKPLLQHNYDIVPNLSFNTDHLVAEGMSIEDIHNLDAEHLSLYHPIITCYQNLIKVALLCIENGTIVPKIVLHNDKYKIMWMPAIMDSTVKSIIDLLNKSYGIKIEKSMANALLSISMILSDLIPKLNKENVDQKDYVESMFFNGLAYDFTALSEKSMPQSINHWTRIFEWKLGDKYKPVLEVSEANNDEFALDIKIATHANVISAPELFSRFVKKIKNNDELNNFYKDLDLLSNYLNGISSYINNGGATPINFNAESFVTFLFEVKPVMFLLGIDVAMPKSLKNLIKPKASMRISSSTSSISSGVLGLANVLDFDWRVSLGDEVVSMQEFSKLVNQANKLLKYKGEYIYISQEEMNALHKQLSKKESLSKVEVLQTALSGEFDGSPIELTDDLKNLITDLKKIDTIDPPKSLQATLRPYQIRGFSWLVKNTKMGIGSIIADDMGLGKTLQVITMITYVVENKLVNDKQILIVVPTSLIPNWQSEFTKFSPSINCFIYYGNNRDAKSMVSADVVITSYGLMRSDEKVFDKINWAIVIIDEAQNIKNPTSQQTKVVKAIKAENYIAMSGTPVENRLMDYWSVMDFANKNLLGNKTFFSKNFDLPISKQRDQETLTRFKNITAPFLMRRMKTDKSIISDLPDKIMQDTYAPLTKEQAALYEKVVQEGMAIIKNQDTDDSKSAFKRKGLVLQLILSLKQICNHPSQWLKKDNSDPSLSGKSELLVNLLSSIIDSGDKVLIFTQFREMGDLLQAMIHELYGINALWLHGGVALKDRKQMVDDFQVMPNKKIMILSLKAGGTGLNLTAANHVIHYDLWWNPAVEAQATDRAFRIGQKKNVIVHRFITQNTFEEKINELINSKKDLADLTVTNGEQWIGDLNNKELENLFALSTIK